MHPHTKFGIPTSKNIGDMHRTRSGTDTRTDTRTDSAITICLPKFLWGHKKAANFKLSAGHVAYRVKDDDARQQHGSKFLTH